MRLLLGIVALIAASCGAEPAARKTAPAPNSGAPVAEIDVPAHHKTIVDSLTVNGDASPDTLYEAALRLERLGATPVGDESDQAEIWKRKAEALDPEVSERFPPYRGRVKGPAYRINTLEAGATEQFEEIFYAAETATLTLETSSSDLELVVTQSDPAKVVCRVTVQSRAKACGWTPIFTNAFAISIYNRSDDPARYILVSN